jgi:AcrR family transcriptional regulator
VLREATRRAGVVPNAAYRHFASRKMLLLAVRAAALSALAVAMESELKTLRTDLPPAALARASLRAIGAAYLRFAQSEPGLFRTAFEVPGSTGPGERDDHAPSTAGESGLDPFELLAAALDRMVEAGALPAGRRADAEYLAWSAVHGLAMLIIAGPLHGIAPEKAHELGQRVIDMVERGL